VLHGGCSLHLHDRRKALGSRCVPIKEVAEKRGFGAGTGGNYRGLRRWRSGDWELRGVKNIKSGH